MVPSVANAMECLAGLSRTAKHYIVLDMEVSAPPALKRRGRPPSFHRDAALHRAMLLFWQHGFEGTSVADLIAAMGITPPSLYAAFGDKKALFREAVARYLDAPDRLAGQASARDMAFDLLRTAAVRFTGEDTPAGCLIATAAASCSPAAADVQAELASVRRDTEVWLRDRIEQDGIATTEAEALAAHVMAVVQGLSTLARDGAGRDKLLRVVDVAMRVWPG